MAEQESGGFIVLGPNSEGDVFGGKSWSERLLDEKEFYDKRGKEYPTGLIEALNKVGIAP